MAKKYTDPFEYDDEDQVDLFELSRRGQMIEDIHGSFEDDESFQNFGDLDDEGNYQSRRDRTAVKNNSAASNPQNAVQSQSNGGDNINSGGSDNKNKRKKKKKTPILKIVLSFACLFVIIAFVLLYNAISKINYVDVEVSGTTAAASEAPDWAVRSELGVTNVLLLGIDLDDTRDSSSQRSDTIMILTLDSINHTIKMTSILRDTYVYIPGRESKSRINHAYAYGGAALVMQTIQSNFRIKIDKYISVDMDGMAEIIEYLGGVDITLTEAEAKAINSNVENSSLTAGEQHLNGAQATYYARIRKIDSDFGRTSRQRTLIKAMLAAFKELNVFEQYSLISNATPYLTTNYSQAGLTLLALKAVTFLSADMEELSVPVSGSYSFQTISGMSVIVPNIQTNCEAIHNFIFGSLPD